MNNETPSRRRKKPAPLQRRSQLEGNRSSLAVASLVLSLLSLILGPLGYVPGIICGHLARSRMRRNAGLRGAGFAKAGLMIGYLGLTLTIAFVAFIVLEMSKSGSGGAAGKAAAAPMIVGPAPVSVKVENFRPKAAGEAGGFTLLIESRAAKPVVYLLLREEYRDADGVLEKDILNNMGLTVPPKGTIEWECPAFSMLPTSRSVTVSVRQVQFADGTTWTPLQAALAAADPGPLSYAGHTAPASAEVIRFRPNQAKQGNVVARLVNHSNKAIQAFLLDVICLDATGNRVDTDGVAMNFLGGESGIEPGGAYEFSRDLPSMSEAARSATLVVRELTFAGDEEWVRAEH